VGHAPTDPDFVGTALTRAKKGSKRILPTPEKDLSTSSSHFVPKLGQFLPCYQIPIDCSKTYPKDSFDSSLQAWQKAIALETFALSGERTLLFGGRGW